MRHVSFAAALSGLVFLIAVPAEAQQRRSGVIIDAKPRSFLDAGRVVPVGRYQGYVYDHTLGTNFTLPHRGISQFEDLPLPDRFSGGRGIEVDFRAPAFLAK